MNVTIEKLKFLPHGNEYSFLTISPHSQTKTSWSAQSPTFSRVITSWNEKSIWPYSHPNVVLRGLITLNIHYRDHGQTINILVEMLKKKKIFFLNHMTPESIVWVSGYCQDADHIYYLLPLAFVLAKWTSTGTVLVLAPHMLSTLAKASQLSALNPSIPTSISNWY